MNLYSSNNRSFDHTYNNNNNNSNNNSSDNGFSGRQYMCNNVKNKNPCNDNKRQRKQLKRFWGGRNVDEVIYHNNSNGHNLNSNSNSNSNENNGYRMQDSPLSHDTEKCS